MEDRQNYSQLISENRFEEALNVLNKLIAEKPEDDVLLFERGKLKWRLGDRSGASNDYAKSSAINPDGPAKFALEQAQEIADFFNPDLYNP